MMGEDVEEEIRKIQDDWEEWAEDYAEWEQMVKKARRRRLWSQIKITGFWVLISLIDAGLWSGVVYLVGLPLWLVCVVGGLSFMVGMMCMGLMLSSQSGEG
jgi:hypothetical protein